MLRRFVLVSLLVPSLLPQAMAAGAQSVRVVTGDDYPPLVGKGLPHGGMFAEIVISAFKAAGVQTESEVLPWARGEAMVKGGLKDATFPYIRIPDREKDYLFSESPFSVAVNVYARADAKWKFSAIEDIKGLRTCSANGHAVEKDIKSAIEKGIVKAEPTSDISNCIKMVLNGKLDFVALPNLSASSLLQQALGGDAGKLVPNGKPVVENPQYVIVGKSNPRAQEILAAFNSGLGKIRASGELERIIAPYMKAKGK